MLCALGDIPQNCSNGTRRLPQTAHEKSLHPFQRQDPLGSLYLGVKCLLPPPLAQTRRHIGKRQRDVLDG